MNFKPEQEITTNHRTQAADIIQGHWNTIRMPDVCRMLGISTAYGYSIVRGLKHYNGTWHCPEKWIRVVLAFGEKA